MSTIPSSLSYLPAQYAQTIHQKLGDKVSELTSGASIKYDEKIWSVQLAQDHQCTVIRAHTSSILYAASFYEDDKGGIFQESCKFESAARTEDPAINFKKNDFPDTNIPYAVQILYNGTLVDSQPTPKITQETHAHATAWFTATGISPALILPQIQNHVVQGSRSGKELESKVEKYKWLYLSLAFLAAAYFVYQVAKGHFIFFKPKAI